MNSIIKSPLRYPGGKSRLAKSIVSLIPSFEEYREPFLGGGSIYVYLKQIYPARKYWTNDLYKNLYHFWNQCQKNPDKLLWHIQQWKDQYIDGKQLHYYLINNIEKFNEIEKGAAFFVLNRITFSGTSESGGYSKMAFEKRFTQSSIERVKRLNYILDSVNITNLDYQQVIEASGKNVFIFLDPPYHSAKKSALYGKNGNLHKSFNHERLSESLKKTTHKWLITYDDSEYIRELYSFANIRKWSLNYSMRNINSKSNQKENELIVCNYDIDIISHQEELFSKTKIY